MRILTNDPDMLNYVNAKLHPLAPQVGSFLHHFLTSCLYADSQNYPIIRPALLEISRKYPADPALIQVEREDSGLSQEDSQRLASNNTGD